MYSEQNVLPTKNMLTGTSLTPVTFTACSGRTYSRHECLQGSDAVAY